jgi:hypothetical protein
MSFAPDQVRIAPVPIDRSDVRSEITDCLAAAFSTDIWTRTPVPVGPLSEPHSALATVEGLSRAPIAVCAYREGASQRSSMIAFALGAVLDGAIVADFGLEPFGARRGDSLLAYIGVRTEARGLRLRHAEDDTFDALTVTSPATGMSLARCLMTRWISVSDATGCQRLYIRTRAEIPAVVHLCDSMGFERKGSLRTTFLGEVQERIVYQRTLASTVERTQ